MAKKEARISINKLESVMKENIIVVPLSGAEDVDITIHRKLSLKDMMQFVENVVSSCIDAETATYTPEIKDFAIHSEILTTYANFNLPSNAEKQYELVYGTNALEQVMEHIDRSQLYEIKEAIDARIKHELRVIETSAAIKANEMMIRLSDAIEQVNSVFGDISGDDFNRVVKNLSEMNSVTDESIVKAVLDMQHTSNTEENNFDKVLSIQKVSK